MAVTRPVGYYRVSSVCELSGGIWERVCLVMSLKGTGGDEPSPGLSPLPLCVRHPEWGMRLWLCHSSDQSWVSPAGGTAGVARKGCPGTGLAEEGRQMSPLQAGAAG